MLTVEYQRLEYRHPALATATPDEVEAAWAGTGDAASPERAAAAAAAIGAPGSFDLAVSLSTFDHSGLGRYGDPVAPDGDLLAMDVMARYLKPSAGLALVTVPLGADAVLWNAMRRYGPVRLPLLLEGWTVVQRVGWSEARAVAPPVGGRKFAPSYEPVFVLTPADSSAAAGAAASGTHAGAA